MATQTPRADALAAFVVFEQEANFTRAAERLAISQPSLHVKIKKLGLDLDLELYVREGRNLRITQAGKRLAEFARGHAARLDRFVGQLHDERSAPPVTLAAGEGALMYLLGDALRSYAKAHPNKLQLQVLGGPAAVTAVQSGLAELAVLAAAKVPASLTSTRLATSHPALAAWPGHPLMRADKLSLEQLADTPLIVPPRGGAMRAALDARFAAMGQQTQVAVEARGWPVALELVRHRVAPAIVNDICRLPPGVRARPLSGLPSVRYWCAWPKGQGRGRALLRALRTQIQSHAKERAPS